MGKQIILLLQKFYQKFVKEQVKRMLYLINRESYRKAFIVK